MVYLGKVSYSVYLMQAFALSAVARLYRHLAITDMDASAIVLKILATFIISFLLGCLAYHLVEKPVGTWLNRIYDKRAAKAQPSKKAEWSPEVSPQA